MHAFAPLATLALLLVAQVHASVYVINPVQATTCTAGQSCQVQWVDNGQSPLLSDIGQCDVAVYYGEYVLVQSLPSVNVATTSSFTFTPDPSAGPNGQYYVVFTSSSIDYQGFSGSFTLTGMSGTVPGGGSSTPASTPATTSSGSSTSAGTTPATSPSGTTTGSAPSDTTAATGSPTLTTPSVATSPTSTGVPTVTTPSTTTTTLVKTSTSTSASASSTPSNAASRVGSSTSLGGLAALLALSGVLAF